MSNYTELADCITFNNNDEVETFNKYSSLFVALSELCEDFNKSSLSQQCLTVAKVYDILFTNSVNEKLSNILSKFPTYSTNLTHNSTIHVDQMVPYHFDYYHCHIDQVSGQYIVADDFDDIITTIDTRDIITIMGGVKIEDAIKIHLLELGLVQVGDVINIVMGKDGE